MESKRSTMMLSLHGQTRLRGAACGTFPELLGVEALMFGVLMMLACGGPPEPVALGQAPMSDGSRLEIVDGTIDLSGLSAYDRGCEGHMPSSNKGSSPCVEHHYYVAPVRDGSEPAVPVKAWVTCPGAAGDTAEACRAWLTEQKRPVGRVMWRHRTDRDSGWAKAIAASGLESAPKAPVLLIE
jgi:hypothetical protein